MYADAEILEFQKILLTLRKYVSTDLGKQEILEIKPISDQLEIERMLLEVSQAKTMIERYDETPMTGVLNVKDSIKRAKIGSTLQIEELLNFVSFIEAESRNKNYIKKIKQLDIASTSLDTYYENIILHPRVKKEIDASIDQTGQIYDDASPELQSVRKKIQVTDKRISEKMNSLLRSEQTKLTDTLITIRNNRLVLPVKAEYKNSFKGIIHDQSASKETVFIEPMACVELNNSLQSLYMEEQDAIEKILYRLSQEVANEASTLEENLLIFTTLDIIFGKAKYALQNDCESVDITSSTIELINARHPLIPREEVVANTIHFHKYHTIVITGPNTGGKTVALKTLGLLSIMVQAGLLIPVDIGSKTMVFSNIFADIGDEQSIEQSLSTFSSHITKIIYILRKLSKNSLILLDELGSGTDPKEGASLAISILDYIRKKSVFSMVTTHYPELKVYAYDLEDTVNASVEFDIDSLKPTYRLQIGIPGTSNALDIALRLGLEKEIIEKARTISLSFDNETSNLIKKLERQSIELHDEIKQYKEEKQKVKEKNDQVDQLIASTKIKQNQLIKDLEHEKRVAIEEAQKQAYELINELDELKKTANFKEHELAKLKHDVKNLNTPAINYQKLNTKKISVGDIVNVVPYQRSGIVMKKRGSQEYEIQMGALSSVFSENQLEFIENSPKSEKKSHVSIHKESIARVELDLRGKRFEEAMDSLDKYIDDCLVNNLEFAYIIHGYGTGALRKGVQEAVKKYKQIKSFRPGGMNEGGSGVTVIYFN
ncbi:MAG: endonuclease MutS2 [Firmicutes bacterium]|nr:endonuclease MutS2 [Bacillota bacterium]